MDWSKVNKTPKYNPHMIQMARHLECLSVKEMAAAAGLSGKKYSDIENGKIEPTEEEMIKITAAQTHVILSFYEQYPETDLDISGPLAKNVPINYYKYKVFRDMNPPPLSFL